MLINGRSRRVFAMALPALLCFCLLIGAAGADANVAYLRPDVDKAPGSGVPVGATRIWDALNDDLTEAETPSGVDYLNLLATGPRQVELDLSSVFIPSGSSVSASAWIYSADSRPVSLRVLSLAGTLAGPVEFTTPGWHSVAVSLSASQQQLDNVRLKLSVPSGSGGANVYSAFLRLVVSDSLPKVYWGSWIDSEIYGNPLLGNAPWDPVTWGLFENHARRPVSIVHFGQKPPWEQEFQATPLEDTRAGGSIPLMDMGTGCRIGKVCKGGETRAEEEINRVSLSEINAGVYDGYFKKWAEDVASYKFPFFFRWAWEMNGSWFKWGRDAKSSPASYVLAWQRIHNIAKAAGAANITWVWCPNVDSVNSPIASAPYPGDAYVDWTCMDGYNEGGPSWRSFSEAFGPTYNALLAIAPSKPIMIGETASAEGAFLSGPGEFGKRTWITDALAYSIPLLYPKIKAINWFNWNIVEGGTERTWPIETSDGAQVAFAAGVNSPYYAEDSYGALPPLAKIQPLP